MNVLSFRAVSDCRQSMAFFLILFLFQVSCYTGSGDEFTGDVEDSDGQADDATDGIDNDIAPDGAGESLDSSGDPDAVDADGDGDAIDDVPDEDGEGIVPTGPWHVEGGRIMDPYGRHAILRGANMAGSHKNDSGSGYLGSEDPEFYMMFGDAGFNVLRFLTTWAAVMPEEGVIDDDYLDRLEERFTWAEDAGLLVFIDMHQDLYGEGFVINGLEIGGGAPFWSCPNNHILTEEQSDWFMYYLDPKVVECFDHFWDDEATQDYFVQAW